MPCNAFISYFPFDTLDAVAKLSRSQKLAQFTEKLSYAARNISTAAAGMRLADPLGFFAVPEYYFLKRLQSGAEGVEVELYSEEERDELIGKLVGLSDRFNHTVILPGTITWRRPAARAVRARRRGKLVDLAYEGLSSAPVLYKGDVVASYEKVMNDGTVDSGTEDTRFAPGTSSPLFTVEGLKCGIEICGDFNEKNLARAAAARSLDFEFMMSATNYHFFRDDMDGIPVRDGGYFLHVDQAPKKAKFYNGVWCVERGKGSFGRALPDDFSAYDPWTMKPIPKDLYGVELSAGHAVALKTVVNNTPASGIHLPGTKPFAGLRLNGSFKLTGPLDTRNGRYEVTLTAELIADAGSTSPKSGRTIRFSAKAASVRPSTATTGTDGKASAVFTCQKDHTAKLTASFHGSKAVGEAWLVWLGAGDITKISALKALPHPEVPTYFAPIA